MKQINIYIQEAIITHDINTDDIQQRVKWKWRNINLSDNEIQLAKETIHKYIRKRYNKIDNDNYFEFLEKFYKEYIEDDISFTSDEKRESAYNSVIEYCKKHMYARSYPSGWDVVELYDLGQGFFDYINFRNKQGTLL